jgi:hypothetical protein
MLYHLTGPDDYIINVAAVDPADFQRLVLNEHTARPEVVLVHTNLIFPQRHGKSAACACVSDDDGSTETLEHYLRVVGRRLPGCPGGGPGTWLVVRGLSLAGCSVDCPAPRLWSLLLAPDGVLLTICFAYPLVMLFAESFQDPALGLESYRQLWQSDVFRAVLARTRPS